jgi:hypothetical protein
MAMALAAARLVPNLSVFMFSGNLCLVHLVQRLERVVEMMSTQYMLCKAYLIWN